MRRECLDVTPGVSIYENVQQFLSAAIVPDGRIRIGNDVAPLDIRNDNVGADTTVVFLHGAIEHDAVLPMFVGQGISSDFFVNRIFISDPSLYIDNDLHIAWYAGSSLQPRLQRDLTRVIDHVLQTTGAQHTIFFGSSAGGFAALMLSRRFPGSLALAMNPQTRIGEFYPRAVRNYLELAWGLDSDTVVDLPDNVTHDVVEAYSGGFRNTIGYIQNARDWFHILNHQEPLLDSIGESSRVFMLMDRWGSPGGDGHVPAAKDVLKPIFESVIGCRGNWPVGLLAAGFQGETTKAAVKRRLMETKPAT